MPDFEKQSLEETEVVVIGEQLYRIGPNGIQPVVSTIEQQKTHQTCYLYDASGASNMPVTTALTNGAIPHALQEVRASCPHALAALQLLLANALLCNQYEAKCIVQLTGDWCGPLAALKSLANSYASNVLPVPALAAAANSHQLEQLCKKYVRRVSFFYESSKTLKRALMKLMVQPKTLPIIVNDTLPEGLPCDWRVIQLYRAFDPVQAASSWNPTVDTQMPTQYLKWLLAASWRDIQNIPQIVTQQETILGMEKKLLTDLVKQYTVKNYWHAKNADGLRIFKVSVSALVKPIKELAGAPISITQRSLWAVLDALGYTVTKPKNCLFVTTYIGEVQPPQAAE